MHKILILGPQGSGKGTQANILAEKLNIPALSMGQLLRNETESQSELGLEIKRTIDQGELVPDNVALQVLKKRLDQPDAQIGYILDGYPRNRAQYEVYKQFDQPSALLVIDVPNDESMRRLLKRAEIEKRVDDTSEKIARRLEIYEEDTTPIIDEYQKQGIAKIINGIGTIEEISERVNEALSFSE
ncbi:MAG: nucleoside monophosphate kinase [Candidatus Uhrbacteria bacterium]|nr:nucleoside monophosphate kinase [Candidatus Uhrbacteria bacterium]